LIEKNNDIKNKNQEMKKNLEENFREANLYRDQIESLQKKLDELQAILSEKEKKINVTYKIFYTNLISL
jgi:prefoldin subunit 5